MRTPPSRPSPSVMTKNDARSGPSAKPTLPPTEKSDMPLARRSPLTKLANLEPSGWYAATPTPETSTPSMTSA